MIVRCDECGERVDTLPTPGHIVLCPACEDEERRIAAAVRFVSRQIGLQRRSQARLDDLREAAQAYCDDHYCGN